jgi:plasmid replication initiation protein
MNEPLPECCKENKITNRAELIDCLTALEDTEDMTIEALRERLKHLSVVRHTDHLSMFKEDEGLLDIYDRARIKIQNAIDALRNLQKPE